MSPAPSDPDAQPAADIHPEPPRLRTLRLLVTALTVTMIVGLITIVTLIVLTFSRGASTPTLPDPASGALPLPAGERLVAITHGTSWSGMVTRTEAGQDRLHLLDPASGAILRSIDITP